tara:strand:- start:3272 stop:3904 length:633 start_codon:yes stop_codon:yes gene_type:complete
MSAYVHNISIDSGADYLQEYDMYEVGGRVVDLTGYSARAQIRKHRDSSTAVSFRISFVDRPAGKIQLSIPSWTTSKLKPGRYCYDVEFTKPNTEIAIVLEGKVNVRAGISTGCSFSQMGSAQRLCIAVIDENAGTQSFAGMYTKWEQFRTTYPNRTFYLLQPTPIGCCGTDSALGTGFGSLVDNNTYTTLHCPSNFLNETTVNTGRLIGQ